MSLTPHPSLPRLAKRWCWTFLLLIATSGTLAAAELEVSEARLRLLPGDLPAAGYFTLTNASEKGVTLTGADSLAFGNVMMHRTVNQDGVTRMQRVEQLVLQAGEQVEFAPGDYHLMLMKRTRNLAIGDDIEVTLRFANGQQQSVTFRAVSSTTQ
ncbi:copper chaperone PCu(A)C [Billgrantia azerbaijanica]|nr:copper chaperone PCu(A)C [Halomonas azerbaijanica]